MQALVKLALEPEWEPRFEANSYGFRPGRPTYARSPSTGIPDTQVTPTHNGGSRFSYCSERPWSELSCAAGSDGGCFVEPSPVISRKRRIWASVGGQR